MKQKILLYVALSFSIIFIGCGRGNRALQNDAGKIAEVMCRSIDAMKNLRMADPSDSLSIFKLQKEYKKVEAEMAKVYGDFNKKYSDKIASKEFTEEFRRYLNEAILDCKSLSSEDRENFEKELKK